MKDIPYGLIITGYFGAVLFSFFALIALALLLDEKYPRFINRKWKRVLWLLSCPMLLPIPVFFLLWGFSSLACEIKKFLSWDDEDETNIGKGGKV